MIMEHFLQLVWKGVSKYGRVWKGATCLHDRLQLKSDPDPVCDKCYWSDLKNSAL